MRVAIIPARGGSKRILKKNIKHFLGKPIIAYSIKAALDSGLFDRVIVSTDDDDIAQVARDYGAEVPFRRPSDLADDHAVIKAVMKHAVGWLEKNSGAVDYACCIYATAPMIDVNDIQQGYSSIVGNDQLLCMAVTSFAFPIQRALTVDERGYATMIHSEYSQTRSQDLTESYHDAAHFIWGSAKAFTADTSARLKAIIIPRYRVQDIDTDEDWRMAELLFGAQYLAKPSDAVEVSGE